MKENNSNINYKEVLLNYLCDLLFISIAIIIYRNLPYYRQFLPGAVQTEILIFAFIYVIFAFPYYCFIASHSVSRSAQIILGLLNFTRQCVIYLKERKKKGSLSFPSLDSRVKVGLLFMMVKFFYIPLMLTFAFHHILSIEGWKGKILTLSLDIKFLYDSIYMLILDIFFLIDTTLYSLGYLVESKYLDNEVKSVDTTLLGWTVTLLCYPPFSIISGYLLPWPKSSDLITLDNPIMTFLSRFFIVLLTGIYVWASIALGSKCSNLTNRGIVSSGPYAFVRHPAYISKNLVWWILTIPYLGIQSILGAAGWGLLYYMRAITEERHLNQDPDYIEYCKKVPWRFIPCVF
ncbi:MAG TPA: methyltransferase [Candidatus Eremiobacteraeota bacterium]|nr:methyltransferase [Candidatus Eremiobacteraeota bacterium]